MTPAEWLAIVLLGSFALSSLWNIFEPDSLVLKFNSPMRLVIAFGVQIAAVVLSLMVLSASTLLIAGLVIAGVLSIAINVARAV